MRTTLTLDDDVAVRLKRLQESNDTSFKAAVNEALRRGLAVLENPPPPRVPYRLATRNLGRPRIPLDNIAEALAVAEGDDFR